MNDTERERWVLNDEFLYNRWKRSRLSMRKFVRTEREDIDSYIASYQRSHSPQQRLGFR